MRNSQEGQALIIILLVMSVVMTVVLSSVSRSVTEVVVTGHEEEALRAFSAAEAGVEEKLLDLGVVGAPPETYNLDTDVSYTVGVAEHNIASNDGKVITYPKNLSSGETAMLWLVSVDEDNQFTCTESPCWKGNNVRVCYGTSGASPAPALEVSVYYDETQGSIASSNNYTNVKVYRKVFDHVVSRTPGSIGGTQVTDGCDYDDDETKEMPYKAVITMSDILDGASECSTSSGIQGCALFIKVRMLYAEDQPIEFWAVPGPTAAIPAQGILISSEGSAGESTRKVEVYQGLPEPLDLFDSAVYSLDGLSK